MVEELDVLLLDRENLAMNKGIELTDVLLELGWKVKIHPLMLKEVFFFVFLLSAKPTWRLLRWRPDRSLLSTPEDELHTPERTRRAGSLAASAPIVNVQMLEGQGLIHELST